MNAVVNTVARQTPTPPAHAADNAGKAAKVDGADLALDITQMGLDIAGIFDPTPISDGASGLISLFRGDFLGAGISAVSMLPYLGDAAKLGKLGRYAETLAKAVDAAKSSPELAKAIGPAMEKLREAIGAVPIDKLPEGLRNAIEPLKTKLDDFARIGVNQVQATVGKNHITWTQNAAGDTIGAKATLNEVFSGAKRSSGEVKDQATAAARGTTDDVGGHMIGHRFAQDQGIKNMFPQNANFNNSAFRKVENEWADWINKKGGSVEVDVQLVGGSSRPDKVKVSYQLMDSNGNAVRQVFKEFDNQAGQIFDRKYF
ncbi:MAG: DNA/RNA non-specific endonuclease [Ottowia sp.]|nr:DNA/RNA non-specific endonuclease [Ottowia sp.]